MNPTMHTVTLLLVLFRLGLALESSLSTSKDYEMYNLTNDVAAGVGEKHHIFASCSAFQLEPEDYTMFPNGTAYVEAYNKTYNSSFYVLQNGILTVCAPTAEERYEINKDTRYLSTFVYIGRICLSISIVCLLAHLVAFCVVPDLRNLPGYNMAALCFSLLLSYISFLSADANTVESSGTACIVLASLIHFLLLSSFMWMVVMSYDVLRSLLKATGKLRLSTRKFIIRRFLAYCLFAYGTSLAFVVAALLVEHTDGVSDLYRPAFGKPNCWFGNRYALVIFFGGPVFSVIILNVIFFSASAYIIYTNRMRTEEVAYRTMVRKNFTLHYRLATIMGLTWIVGFANASNNFWLIYIYILLSTLQGLFIFIACTCTAKVKNCIMKKLNIRVRKPSSQSTTATFQSYWKEEFASADNIYVISGKEMVNAVRL